MIDIARLSFEVHSLARANGFWDAESAPSEKLMLIVSELSEALEELRAGHSLTDMRDEDGKPEGFPVEIADAVIRILDMCAGYGINIEAAIARKHAYNLQREFKHGKAF